jgi:tRNA pseudouridine38-40 synthase
MNHYQATIEYDGTDFHGFQKQLKPRTIQGVLEEVLSTLSGGKDIKVRGAGRTDRGVHATGQVIDFQLAWHKDEIALQHACNAILPSDVAIRKLSLAKDGFHPRYDATSRVYIYTLLNAALRQPLMRRTTYYEPHAARLNDTAMNDAVRRLVGEHDFASFGRATTATLRTTRTMLAASVWREGDIVNVGLEANGFLFRMVRSIVGCLLLIGRGQKFPDWIDELLVLRNRGAAAQVIGPQGLCLVAVRYPDSSPIDYFSH